MDQSNDANQPLLIAVLGVTGAGKTTFISKATGKTNMKIGHGMEACTQEMEMADMVLDGRRIILIDTPGFDDTYKSDTEILELIAKHLSITFEAGKLLNGIILLQPINANRVVGQERKRTRLFEKICGENAYRNVVIATTFWGEIGDKAKGIAREKERIQNDGFWGQLVKKGARTARHENNKESALDVVRMLLDKPKVALQMQQEMAANGGRFGDTSAGLELNKELNEQCAKLAMELVETKAEARKSKEDLTEEIKALKEKMELLEEQKELIEASRIVWPKKAIQKVKDAFDNFTDFCSESGDLIVAGGTVAGVVAVEVVYLAPLVAACVVM